MYKCVYCHKEFEKPHSLAAHVSMCKKNPKYLENLEKRKLSRKNTLEKLKEPRKTYNLICSKCGKEFSLQLKESEYLKGNYRKTCSAKCANSHSLTSESKDKISKGVRNYILNNIEKYSNLKNSEIDLDLYIQNKTKRKRKTYLIICKECGKEHVSHSKDTKFCSLSCASKYNNRKYKETHDGKTLGGYKEGSVKNYKSGRYKGIWCDSSWELAFILYHLDRGEVVERNREIRYYNYYGQWKKFYPDFKINSTIYEIKGRQDEYAKAKYKYNEDIIFLYKEDMKKYIEYDESVYGKNFISLYEIKN